MDETVLKEKSGSHPPEDVPLIMDLRKCLFRLSPLVRETILLKINGGLTYREISEIFGENLSTVSARYRRGIETVKGLLT